MKKAGAPRKYKYDGTKKTTSIRLSKEERKLILDKYNSIQEFIQDKLKSLKNES